MIRAIALSLVLLFGVGVVIPLVSDIAEAGPKKKKQRKYAKKKQKVKKYSKQWWRQYRARIKRKKAIQARKRALRLRQLRLARLRRSQQQAPNRTVSKTPPVTPKQVKEDSTPAVLPTGETAPRTWKKNQASQTELQFRVDDENGSQLGSAAISVVGPAMGDDNASSRVKTVGGVPTASLRRNVIDQMIKENGWVVNDYQKEIGGKKVYVVVAQSESKSGVQSRVFYFTEVDGRIYSVSTNSSTDRSERIAEESEKVLNMLVRRPQRAELK